jgi:predicted PurR-regulated permease PerM
MPAERRVEQIVRIAAIVLLVVGCLLVLQPFLGALLAAAILCFSTWPVYRFIEDRTGGRRWLAALDRVARLGAAYFCFWLTACQRPLTSPCIG